MSAAPKDSFFKMKGARTTRIKVLEQAVADGVATEGDIMELEELKHEAQVKARPQTIAEFKGGGAA